MKEDFDDLRKLDCYSKRKKFNYVLKME